MFWLGIVLGAVGTLVLGYVFLVLVFLRSD